MTAYYNEHDAFAAGWLRELISAGLIAPGDVDERDIQDVVPTDLVHYTQCHFFAGIGGWSYALRRAGWPDDLPVWTGSCPCQPFSAAGAGKGVDDERHLWPEFRWLIDQCRPAVVFGEQVAGKAGLAWLAGIRSDLETMAYALGAADLCAAGAGEEAEGLLCRGDTVFGWQPILAGAPDIRQRNFWLAVADNPGQPADRRSVWPQGRHDPGRRGASGGVGCPGGAGLEGQPRHGGGRDQPGWIDPEPDGPVAPSGAAGGVGNAACIGRYAGDDNHDTAIRDARATGERSVDRCGFWSDFDILPCSDGKSRRVEPGTFPLAHGVPARVGRLRGYGNAINPEIAASFITASIEAVRQTTEKE